MALLYNLDCSTSGGTAPGYSIGSEPLEAHIGDEVWVYGFAIQISGPVTVSGVYQDVLPWDRDPPADNCSGVHFRIVEGTTSGYVYVRGDDYPWVRADWLEIVEAGD